MAQFVAAMAMTHNPRIYGSLNAASSADRELVFANFGVLRDALRAARADALIVLANDHFDNFFLDNMPAFCIGLTDHAEGPFWYEHEIQKCPEYRAPIHADLAEALLRGGREGGVDFACTQEFRLDHAFCIPLSFVAPDGDVPVVPVFTNVFAYPLVTGKRFFEVGRLIRDVVAARPAHERVAVLASINMSAEVGGPKMGKRDLQFDDLAVDLMRQGDVERILAEITVDRMLEAGNSTTEYLNYLALLGIIGEQPPDFLEFRIVPGWGNCPAIAWRNVNAAE